MKMWQEMKTFIDIFNTSNEIKSSKDMLCREELARMHLDDIRQEFTLAVDIGVHLTGTTYQVEEDSMLESGKQEATG